MMGCVWGLVGGIGWPGVVVGVSVGVRGASGSDGSGQKGQSQQGEGGEVLHRACGR